MVKRQTSVQDVILSRIGIDFKFQNRILKRICNVIRFLRYSNYFLGNKTTQTITTMVALGRFWETWNWRMKENWKMKIESQWNFFELIQALQNGIFDNWCKMIFWYFWVTLKYLFWKIRNKIQMCILDLFLSSFELACGL